MVWGELGLKQGQRQSFAPEVANSGLLLVSGPWIDPTASESQEGGGCGRQRPFSPSWTVARIAPRVVSYPGASEFRRTLVVFPWVGEPIC